MVFQEAYAMSFIRPPGKDLSCSEVLNDLRHSYTDPHRIAEPGNSPVPLE